MYDYCMINTLNISLPQKLREQANELVKKGYYASFSDLTRTAIRKLLNDKYDLWLKEAREDVKKGRAVTLDSQEDIDKFIQSLP